MARGGAKEFQNIKFGGDEELTYTRKLFRDTHRSARQSSGKDTPKCCAVLHLIK
jgi:hypothetical protein